MLKSSEVLGHTFCLDFHTYPRLKTKSFCPTTESGKWKLRCNVYLKFKTNISASLVSTVNWILREGEMNIEFAFAFEWCPYWILWGSAVIADSVALEAKIELHFDVKVASWFIIGYILNPRYISFKSDRRNIYCLPAYYLSKINSLKEPIRKYSARGYLLRNVIGWMHWKRLFLLSVPAKRLKETVA